MDRRNDDRFLEGVHFGSGLPSAVPPSELFECGFESQFRGPAEVSAGSARVWLQVGVLANARGFGNISSTHLAPSPGLVLSLPRSHAAAPRGQGARLMLLLPHGPLCVVHTL